MDEGFFVFGFRSGERERCGTGFSEERGRTQSTGFVFLGRKKKLAGLSVMVRRKKEEDWVVFSNFCGERAPTNQWIHGGLYGGGIGSNQERRGVDLV